MTDYREINDMLSAVIDGVDELISNLSNASALLNENLDNINWVGFYIMKNGRLVLGPFQGKIACTEIEVGKGVCGAAVKTEKTQLVPNVHDFPGHIACDKGSNSEIVVPIFKSGQVVAVLDIDSPILNRFDENDKAGLEEFSKIISRCFNG